MKRLIYLLLFFALTNTFAQVTDGTLQNEANIIKNETGNAQNTAVRIGTAFSDFNSGKMSRVENNVTSGTNTYTATITWVTGYRAGLFIPITFINVNSGASTLNVNGFGAKNIVLDYAGTALTGGELKGSTIVMYNGTNFQIIGGSGSALTFGNLTTPTTGVSITGGTGAVIGSGTAISIQTASTSQTGLLTNTDWNTFNSKINLTSLSASSPLSYNNTTGAFSLPSWPSNSAGALTNDGAGALSWVSYLTSFTETDPIASAINGWLKSNGTTLSAVTGTGYPKFSGTSPSFITAIPNGDLANSSITIAGNTTSLGGSVTQDNITGLSSTGIIKRTAANTLAIAVAGTDYISPYGSQTANFFLASPNGLSGTPSFRAIVAADIPTLNQNTTGSAATLTTARNIAITGDLAWNVNFDGSGNVTAAGTLATVNSNTGSWGSATQVPQFTVNSKGLITAASNVTITPAVGSITGLGTGVSTALGTNVGSAGAFVVNGGALGTPSSGTLTNATGLPISSGVSGLGTNWTTALGANLGSGWTTALNAAYSSVATSVTNALTVDNSSLQLNSGTTYDGSAARTISVKALGITNSMLAGSIDLTTKVTNALPYANGGTNASTSWTSGSVLFAGTSALSQDNSNFYWNSGSHLLSVNTGGDQTGTDAINVYNQIDAYLPNSSQGSLTTSGATSGFTFSSSRGTGASPSNLNAGDLIGQVSGWGYTNSAYTPEVMMAGYMSGSTTTNLGGEFRFYTKADGGSLTQRFTLDNAGRAKINSGGLDIIGIGTTTNKGINYTQSDGTTNAFNIQDNGTTTHNATLGTVSTNNTYSWSNTTTASSSTASNYLGGMLFNNTFTANAATLTFDGITSDYTVIATGGISTLNNSGSSGSQGSTLAGMTAGTYTNIQPSSTTGGSGSADARFTVVVTNATTIASITQTTPGTNYKLNDGVVFNGSIFQGTLSGGGGLSSTGTGSVTFLINAITGSNSYTTQSAPFTAIPRIQDLRGAIKPWHSLRNFNNTSELASINFSYPSAESALAGSMNINIGGTTYAAFGGSQSNIVLSKNVSLGNNTLTVNGAATLGGSSTFSSNILAGSGYDALASSQVGAFTITGGLQAQYQVQQGTINTGVINTFSNTTALPAGTGYTAGSKSLTGGTGTNASMTITVSGGVIQTTVINNRGTGYSVGDVLTISTGSNNVTVTITAVDFASGIAAFSDNSTITDAKSNYSYSSYNVKNSYNITSTQPGNLFSYYDNSTYTSIGSFAKFNIVYEGSLSLGGIGKTAVNVKNTWDINGSLGTSIVTSTGSLSLDATNYTVIITSGTGSYTLPSASGATNRIYVIVNQTGSSRTVSTYKDKSGASQTTVGANASLWLQSDGSNYYQIN